MKTSHRLPRPNTKNLGPLSFPLMSVYKETFWTESSPENTLTFLCAHCISLLAASKTKLRYCFIGVSVISILLQSVPGRLKNEFYQQVLFLTGQAVENEVTWGRLCGSRRGETIWIEKLTGSQEEEERSPPSWQDKDDIVTDCEQSVTISHNQFSVSSNKYLKQSQVLK